MNNKIDYLALDIAKYGGEVIEEESRGGWECKLHVSKSDTFRDGKLNINIGSYARHPELCEEFNTYDHCFVTISPNDVDKLIAALLKVKEEILNKKEECQHNWVMDGHNAGNPICSKCYKR